MVSVPSMYVSMFACHLLRDRWRYRFEVWHEDNHRSGTWCEIFFMVKRAALLLKSAKICRKEKEEEEGESGKASNFPL